MYLKMTLADQLIEERFIPASNTYGGGALQKTIEELIADHEQLIEACGEQPHFLLSSQPTVVKKKNRLVAAFSKLASFHQMFGS